MSHGSVRILGCGSSGGVPLITGNWGHCNPTHPRNNRTRPSILIQYAGKNILVDASPDVRQQLLRAQIQTIDALIITHAHADHCHGMDDLRQIFLHQGRAIPVFSDDITLARLQHMFNYMFETKHPIYPAYFEAHTITPGQPLDHVMLHDVPVPIIPFTQHHGHQRSLGVRFGNCAYSTDVNDFPTKSHSYLQNLDLWIVDCLRYHAHPTHAHFDLTCAWIHQFQPKRAVLTHMSEFLDYDDIAQKCKSMSICAVQPGYDGMILNIG